VSRRSRPQRTVCFTETPLEHVRIVCRPITDCRFRFDGYGLAFTKSFARRRGANPVWYLDISQRGRDWLTGPVNRLVKVAEALATGEDAGITDGSALAAADILQLTLPIEQMGPHQGRPKGVLVEVGMVPRRALQLRTRPRRRRLRTRRRASLVPNQSQGDEPGRI